MAEGPTPPVLHAVSGAPAVETIPLVPTSQLGSGRSEDPHESVTLAPPAPNFDELLRQPTPTGDLSPRSGRHFGSALDAGHQAGLTLGELTKTVAELSAGVLGAKRANEQLVHELTTLRAVLGSANEQNAELKQRIAELEQELVTVRRMAEEQRQFLTDQQDQFLAALLDEHEAALTNASEADTRRMNADVSDLTQKLVQVESARHQAELACRRAREALAKVQGQRDEAQTRAQSRERERDELRAEASMLRARLGMLRTVSTTPPPPLTTTRPPSFRPPPALELDSGELASNLHSRRTSPLPPISAPLRAAGLERADQVPRVDTQPGVGGPPPSDSPPPPRFGPPPSVWTPPPPPPELAAPPVRSRAISAASMAPGQIPQLPALRQKPDPTSRPLISYSLGKGGVESELLEGARISSKPPRK
jgi:hypothetical protein